MFGDLTVSFSPKKLSYHSLLLKHPLIDSLIIMAHLIRHKISSKIISIVNSASHKSERKVSGVFARLGFQAATDEEAIAFAERDGLDYEYRHGMRMEEVRTSGEREGMVAGDSHYQRHGTAPPGSRKTSESSDAQGAQDKITAWDAGWNVTNAIQVHSSCSKCVSSRIYKTTTKKIPSIILFNH